MSSFNTLLDVIRAKSALLRETEDEREDMGALFLRAITRTNLDIRHGADADDFPDLVVVNLIILGTREGYDAPEMAEFIQQLKSDEDMGPDGGYEGPEN